MRKEAVGIAINGRDVKIAHVSIDKHRLAVDFLESAILLTDIESAVRKRAAEKAEMPLIEQEDDVFTLKSSYETGGLADSGTGSGDNADVLYSLLRKFAIRKIKVAFNISPSQVSYQDLDTHLDYDQNVFKGKLRQTIENWKKGFNALENVSVVTRSDGTLCNVSCELQQPPIIDILERLNSFYKGNLYLSLMDPNEISLVNLTRNSYNFSAYNEITVIVEIEAEFSRIIFMKGSDLFIVSPIISEGFNPDINDIIYSKIIYELDNYNIPEVSNILLASKASSLTAKEFFEKKFPKTKVGFIISQPLSESISTPFKREDLSEYAIPIALAWKLVDDKSDNFIQTNLLPAQIINRQKVLGLSLVGYLILILLGLTAFILTWQITANKLEINRFNRKNLSLQQQIDHSESTVQKVRQTEEEIAKLKKRIAFSDSLSQGSDMLLSFLEKLNQSALEVKSVWIDEVKNTNRGLAVKGRALKRSSVPDIAEALGAAQIKKLTRTTSKIQRIFNFEMEVDWTKENFPSRFREPKEHEIPPSDRPSSIDTKIASATSSERRTSTTSDQNKYDTNDSEQKLASSMKGSSEKLSLSREDPQVNLTDGSSNFTIRISAHATRLTAKKEVESYRSKGYETKIAKFPNSSREIPYWICMGDFSTYEEAEQKLSELKNVKPGDYKIVNISGNRISRYERTDRSKIESTQEKSTNNKPIKEANHTVALSHSKNHEKEPGNGTTQASTSYSAEHFTIKVSAHAIKFTARKDVEFYRSKGYDSFVTTFPNSSREVPYWVCLGNFGTYSEAEEKVQQLSQVIPRDYEITEIQK
ncbi:MAG: SPOR domain-containing protein [bacterium]|nr:MAG: SPOR domain-containing protein [bacterium]